MLPHIVVCHTRQWQYAAFIHKQQNSEKRREVFMKTMKLIKTVMAALPFILFSEAAADTETVGNYTWTYRIIGDSAEIHGTSSGSTIFPSKPTTHIDIPSTLGKKPVTSIGDYALYNCYDLPSVTIPSSVTNIGNRAFYNCRKLSEISLPNGLTKIGELAFCDCYSFREITIPGTVKTISRSAFGGCSAITNIVLNEGLVSIGEKAFNSSKIKTRLSIPSTVTSIGEKAFSLSSSYQVGNETVKACPCIVFLGDCPSFSLNALSSDSEGPQIYVKKKAVGFPTKIPGTWRLSYTDYSIDYMREVRFNANGGSVSVNTYYLVPGDAIGMLPIPSRTGYTFIGWFTAKSGGTKISSATTVSADITYYAHWSANQYVITFNANGGIGGTDKKLAYDTTLGALPEPTHDSFDFGGWWTATSGGTQVSASTKVTGDVTYYAHWIDPIPALASTATDTTVAETLSGVIDGSLSVNITTYQSYADFRQWIDSKELSHKVVRNAPNAWFSYVLDAPGLMAKPEPLASEDIVIESIAPSSTASGTFDLAISIAGAEIGEGARLAETLGIEGATELDESAFSPEGLVVSLERTVDGRIKATVTPEGSPTSFFLRVRVK